MNLKEIGRTEVAGVGVTLRSNIARDTGYLEPGIHGFPQSLPENAGIVSQIGQDRFLPNPF
jgi:hypothetical protein